MTQKNIIKMISGINMLARKSAEIVKSSSADYIEKNVINGKYVSYKEHEQLRKLVLQLQKEISDMKAKRSY